MRFETDSDLFPPFRLKLHKVPDSERADFSSQSAHLADKYNGQLAFDAVNSNNQQIRLGGSSSSRGTSGRYPPSRDGEFRTMVSEKNLEESIMKGGLGSKVPLTK